MIDYGKFFPIKKYYETFVIPINKKKYFIDNKGLLLCPLHPDKNPSMGVVKNKNGESYHCFGCNLWGDILDLHVGVSRKVLGKIVNREQALTELCKIFDVDVKTVPVENDLNSMTNGNNNVDSQIRREQAIKEAIEKFDMGDYHRLFIKGKMEEKSLTYFNSLLITGIDYVKSKEEEE